MSEQHAIFGALKSSTDLLTVIAFSFKSRHISLDETRYAPAPKIACCEQHAIFGAGAYRVSSREMWRDLKENAMTVSKSVK
jgi:hypothetical protein